LYWHSTKFKEKDHHIKKFLECRDKGIKLIQISEDEYKDKKEIVYSRVNNLLGISTKIHGRKCTVDIVDNSATKEFLNNNHIRGYCSSAHNYGLYYDSKLVSVMTFGKPRYAKEFDYELLRFCNIKDISVVGGASKLLSAFIRDANPQSIISYADRNWSGGQLYRSLGFENVTVKDDNYGFFILKKKGYTDQI